MYAPALKAPKHARDNESGPEQEQRHGLRSAGNSSGCFYENRFGTIDDIVTGGTEPENAERNEAAQSNDAR